MSVLIEGLARRYGLLGNPAGIQINGVVSTRKITPTTFKDTDVCDHNCVIADGLGNYECPAAFSKTRNSRGIAGFASKDVILASVRVAAEGIIFANKQFASGADFRFYTSAFKIPDEVRDYYRRFLISGASVEVNSFGGNPEMHRDCAAIIAGIKEMGHRANLTTTGRRIMLDEVFRQELLAAKPDVLALSYDFTSPAEVSRLGEMDSKDIRGEWEREIRPMNSGQRQKAYEAAYVARYAQENGAGFPPVMFNLVVHSGNVANAVEIIQSLRESFGNVRINPYPAQTSFNSERANMSIADLPHLKRFIDWSIDETVRCLPNELPIVPRLHYWLMLKAAITGVSEDRAKEALSGFDVWQCYRRPGAGRYLQIGRYPRARFSEEIAGLRLNCFWNDHTIAGEDYVFKMTFDKIADYALYGRGYLADKVNDPCHGCIMPRLTGDIMMTELGMSDKIWPEYLELRRKYLAF